MEPKSRPDGCSQIDRFPNFVRMAPLLTAGGPDERFEWGLDVILRGLASFVPPTSG